MIKIIFVLLIFIFLLRCISREVKVESLTVFDYTTERFSGEKIYINEIADISLVNSDGFEIDVFIKGEDFRKALKFSLLSSRIFNKYDEDNLAWSLSIRNLNHFIHPNPTFRSEVKISCAMKYSFSFKNKVNYETEIEQIGFIDANSSSNRPMGKVIDGMALCTKNNIREFLEKISKLRFHPDGTITSDQDKIIPQLN